MEINEDQLRSYLMDYYGSAVFSGLHLAFFDYTRVKTCSAEELIRIARKEKVDLSRFIIKNNLF